MTFTLSETYKLIPRRQRLLFFGVLFLQLVLSVLFIRTQAVTIDEGGYYSYGIEWAKGNMVRKFAGDDSKSPIVIPSLIPRTVKQLKDSSYKPTDYGRYYMLQGRYFMWIFVLLTSYVFLCWGYRLYGEKGWIIPLILLLFDPLFFSYGMIIGSDIASAFMLLSLCYTYWRYRQSSKKKYLLLAALFLGLGITTKISLLFIFPLAVTVFLIRLLLFKDYRAGIKSKLIEGVILCVIPVLVINAAYFFKGTGNTLNDYVVESKPMIGLKNTPFINKIPIPVPYPFWQSIDMSLYHAEIGGGRVNSTYSGVFLNGIYKQNGIIWYYYFVMSWYKMPLFILLLLAAAIIYDIAKRRKQPGSNKLYYLVPLFYFLLTLSFFNSFQIGIRHIILIFPFIYLATGDLVAAVLKTKWRYIFFTLMAIHFTLLFKVFPHWMAYTNEILWDKTKVVEHIVDCSVDYGQSDNFLPQFLKDHPEYKYPSATPDTGKFIVELRNLGHEWKSDPDPFIWLRENFKPVGEYATVFLLYDIKEADLKKIKQAGQ